jgi:hypothetical protein
MGTALELKEVEIEEETAVTRGEAITEAFAAIAKNIWTCLTNGLGAGAAGATGEPGTELLTQHELSQAQRLQHDCAF